MNFVTKSLPTVGVLLLVSAANGYAADMQVKAAPIVQPTPMLAWVSPILAANNQISLDVIGQHIDYLERSADGAPMDSERGWQPGLQLTGSVMRDLGPITNVYVMGQFTWANDNTYYVGGTSTNPTYGSLVNHSGAETRDFDFRLGKGFDVGQNWMFTPYFGIGYRAWDRNLTGATGYHERYEHSYAGGGLMIQWAVTQQWVISANGLIGSTFDPQMRVTPNGGFAAVPFTYDLGTKTFWRTGLSTDYALTPQWHLNAGFDYTNFRYGNSSNTSPDGMYEPDSRSGIWTVKAGIGYSFYQPSARY